MKCPKCQFENVETAKFCINCGNLIAQENPEEAGESVTSEPVKPKKKKKSHKQLITGVLMVVLTTVFCISSSVITEIGMLANNGNSVGNIINCGYVDAEGNHLYFSNTEDDGCLYKMKKDGSELQKLTENRCFDINVYKGYVYYRTWGEKMPMVCRISTDGGEEEVISEVYGENVQIEDDILYFVEVYDEGKICASTLDGIKRTTIIDDICWELNVVGDWIYYSNDSDKNYPGSLYRYKIDSDEIQRINSEATWDINVVGDWVYYISVDYATQTTCLVKCKTDGSERTVLCGETCWNTNVYGDYIFYTNEFQGNTLWRMNLDGSGKQALTEEPCKYVNVVDDMIYYVVTDEEEYEHIYKMDLNGKNKELLIKE